MTEFKEIKTIEDFERKIKELQEKIKKYPDHPDLWVWKDIIYVFEGKIKKLK